MKLRELFTPAYRIETIDGAITCKPLHESAPVTFKVDSKGGAVKGKGLATIPNDSLSVGTIAGLATHEIRKRFSKKKHTIHFFAKDVDDRRLYKKIVDDLMKTGFYKQVRRVHASGGILWELSRKLN